eukprot:6207072-Pleurochrysis_carterae.AAC.1
MPINLHVLSFGASEGDDNAQYPGCAASKIEGWGVQPISILTRARKGTWSALSRTSSCAK